MQCWHHKRVAFMSVCKRDTENLKIDCIVGVIRKKGSEGVDY